MRFFEFYLWAQLLKVSMYVFWGLIIMLGERITYFIMLIASYILPVALLDWIRFQWMRSVPRLLRGFRDPQVTPDMNYTTPDLCRARGYPCEEHYVRTRDGFILGLHRIPYGHSDHRSELQQQAVDLQSRHERLRFQTQFEQNEREVGRESDQLPNLVDAAGGTPSNSHTSSAYQYYDQLLSRLTSNGAIATSVTGFPGATDIESSTSASPASTPSPSTSPPRSRRAQAASSPDEGPTLPSSSSSPNLPGSASSENVCPPPIRQRPVVFVMHGFLQSSESWVSTENNLPFMLADAGFDVWLGNCRGNKYSCKHERLDPESADYWDFCVDDTARTDLPALVDYICSLTRSEKISYVGFSQGTAVGFAGFSINPELTRRINIFCALGPATHLKGFENKLIDALTRCSPHIVYLVLGRKRLLPSTVFWQQTLSVKALVKTIDFCVKFLFGWDMRNVHPKDKPQHYAHIYSYSSVKSVVQWFQFMSSGRFQMYDDHKWRGQNNKTYIQPHYPVQQIGCPLAIFYGGRDQLPDTSRLLASVPKDSFIHEEPSYEHLDFMYARSALTRVYPRIVQLCIAATTNSVLTPGEGPFRAPTDAEHSAPPARRPFVEAQSGRRRINWPTFAPSSPSPVSPLTPQPLQLKTEPFVFPVAAAAAVSITKQPFRPAGPRKPRGRNANSSLGQGLSETIEQQS